MQQRCCNKKGSQNCFENSHASMADFHYICCFTIRQSPSMYLCTCALSTILLTSSILHSQINILWCIFCPKVKPCNPHYLLVSGSIRYRDAEVGAARGSLGVRIYKKFWLEDIPTWTLRYLSQISSITVWKAQEIMFLSTLGAPENSFYRWKIIIFS